eukprot:4718804-Prymnesium_polylepis.1
MAADKGMGAGHKSAGPPTGTHSRARAAHTSRTLIAWEVRVGAVIGAVKFCSGGRFARAIGKSSVPSRASRQPVVAAPIGLISPTAARDLACARGVPGGARLRTRACRRPSVCPRCALPPEPTRPPLGSPAVGAPVARLLTLTRA